MPDETTGFPPETGQATLRQQESGPENYLDALAADIGLLVPNCPLDLLRVYALLALVKGDQVTEGNVHDAWSAWRAMARPDHPSLIPFGDLAPGVQALDKPYADAIRRVASHVELPDGDLVTVSREDLRALFTKLGGAWFFRESTPARAAEERLRAAAEVTR